MGERSIGTEEQRREDQWKRGVMEEESNEREKQLKRGAIERI
jgi:hypothetical protein